MQDLENNNCIILDRLGKICEIYVSLTVITLQILTTFEQRNLNYVKKHICESNFMFITICFRYL